MRFPKTIQSTANVDENQVYSVVAHDTLDAIFSGGSLTQNDLKVGGQFNAHVGRISMSQAMWVWHRQF